MIRPARPRDLDALVALETSSFRSDRLTRRSFRRHLGGDGSGIIVDAARGRIRGYVLLFFRAGSTVARLYSIAVDAEARGRGVGRGLLRAAEREAAAMGRATMRLEIRKDNEESLALFTAAGYRKFAETEGYYEDGMGALRFEKTLRRPTRPCRGGAGRRKAA